MVQPIRDWATILVFQSAKKLGRILCDNVSCQVSFKSVQWFQRRSRITSQPIRGWLAILVFRSAKKTQTW